MIEKVKKPPPQKETLTDTGWSLGLIVFILVGTVFLYLVITGLPTIIIVLQVFKNFVLDIFNIDL